MDGVIEDLFSLSGRTALVTGASTGIGRAIAEGLGRAGAAVVLVARRDRELRLAVDQLHDLGIRAAYVSADLGDRAALARAADEAAVPFGDPDLLVHAAGVNIRPPLPELTLEDWDRTMAVNLDAAFLLAQRFGPGMAERGWGRIITVGSQQAIRAFGNSGGYGASKAGVVGLTRSLAEAWSSRGVCCNAIVPGFVKTDLTRAVFDDPEREAQLAARTMIGRNGLPEDFVGAAVFLAGAAASYVTGQMIFVDGGFSVT